jgi:hypothetical protein
MSILYVRHKLGKASRELKVRLFGPEAEALERSIREAMGAGE